MSDAPGKNTISAQADAGADDTGDGQSSLDDRMADFQPAKIGHIDPPPDRFTWQPGDITWDDDSDHPEEEPGRLTGPFFVLRGVPRIPHSHRLRR